MVSVNGKFLAGVPDRPSGRAILWIKRGLELITFFTCHISGKQRVGIRCKLSKVRTEKPGEASWRVRGAGRLYYSGSSRLVRLCRAPSPPAHTVTSGES